MTIRVKRKTAIITTVAFLLLAGGIALVMIQIRRKPTMVNLKSVKVPTSDAKNSSKVTTTKILTDTSVLSSSTTTTLVYKNISINLSTPIDEETITSDSIPVRTIINGATSGTCTVTFEKDGSQDVKESAPVIQAATYYTCQGFDIDKSKFTSMGKWTMYVAVKNGNSNGKSEERTVTIK